jgi:hypothetical protein
MAKTTIAAVLERIREADARLLNVRLPELVRELFDGRQVLQIADYGTKLPPVYIGPLPQNYQPVPARAGASEE